MLRVKSRREWRKWLAKNHKAKKEIWLVFQRKASGESSIPYRKWLIDSVEEAICYGWIDSRIKRIDELRSVVRFTPRRSGSGWSKYNVARAGKLIRQGKMTRAGLAVLPGNLAKTS